MPTPATAKWPKPRSEDEFEDIVVDFARLRWKDPNAQRHGRRGQRQHGVDVVGHPPWLHGAVAAAQCKNTDALSLAEVLAEVEKAKLFPGGLAEFYIVTSGERDAALQSQVRGHLRATPAPFDVEVIFWPDLVADVSADEALVQKHWKGFVSAEASGATSSSRRYELPSWLDRDGAKENELTELHREFLISSPVLAGLDSTEMTAAFEHALIDRPKDFMSSYLTRRAASFHNNTFTWSMVHREYANVLDKWQMKLGPGGLMVRRWSSFSTHDLLLFDTVDLLNNVVQPFLTYENAVNDSGIRSHPNNESALLMRFSVFATKQPRLHDNANILAGNARHSSPTAAEAWQVELQDDLRVGAKQIGLRLLNRIVARFRYDDTMEPLFAHEQGNRLVRIDEDAYRARLD